MEECVSLSGLQEQPESVTGPGGACRESWARVVPCERGPSPVSGRGPPSATIDSFCLDSVRCLKRIKTDDRRLTLDANEWRSPDKSEDRNDKFGPQQSYSLATLSFTPQDWPILGERTTTCDCKPGQTLRVWGHVAFPTNTLPNLTMGQFRP